MYYVNYSKTVHLCFEEFHSVIPMRRTLNFGPLWRCKIIFNIKVNMTLLNKCMCEILLNTKTCDFA